MKKAGLIFLLIGLVSLSVSAMEAPSVSWSPPLRGVTVHDRLTEDDLRHLAGWGADHVRVMLMSGHIRESQPPYAIQEEQLKRLDRFLDGCEKYKLRAILDVHETPGRVEWGGVKDRRLWEDYAFHDLLNETWAVLAERYKNRGEFLVGYDLFNEPNMDRQEKGTPSDWNALAKRLTETIRKVDTQRVIVVESAMWGSVDGLKTLEPTGDPHTVYSFHFYKPMQFTHQGVNDLPLNPPQSYPGTVLGRKWDKAAILQDMQPALDFQRKYDCHLYVGEFSAIRWAPGDSGVNYLRDVISICEEQGWSWAYHAYREWPGWSLEHEGPPDQTQGPLASTPRLDLLKTFWEGTDSRIDFPSTGDQ